MQGTFNKKSMIKSQTYMRRCFELARRGLGAATPNPLVGAVLVHKDRIIGEGYHRAFGEAHAEVNALKDAAAHRRYFSESTLYVSLEPCCFFGKTPACTQLILDHNIPKVVIATLDVTPKVNGKGVEILRAAGVEVEVGLLKEEGDLLVSMRSVFVQKRRPYVILKFAQTADGFIGQTNRQVPISNHFTKRLVHKWRSEVDAIMIGTNTALIDNPALTTRHYFGQSPLRVVLDRNNKLPAHLQLWNKDAPTLAVSKSKHTYSDRFFQHSFNEHLLSDLLHHLQEENIGSLMVEGGKTLLESFINQNLWDEARVVINSKTLGNGVRAPAFNQQTTDQHKIEDDTLLIYHNEDSA